MAEIFMEHIWPRLGLMLNLVGTIMIACSFGKNLGGAYQETARGQKIYLTSLLYSKLFKWGLFLLIIGFLLQIVIV